jgi:hypothetical protein
VHSVHDCQFYTIRKLNCRPVCSQHANGRSSVAISWASVHGSPTGRSYREFLISTDEKRRAISPPPECEGLAIPPGRNWEWRRRACCLEVIRASLGRAGALARRNTRRARAPGPPRFRRACSVRRQRAAIDHNSPAAWAAKELVRINFPNCGGWVFRRGRSPRPTPKGSHSAAQGAAQRSPG